MLLFLLAAPGLAVASLLPRLDRAARIVVAVTAAIAINALVAATMVAVGAWWPAGGLLAIAVISPVIWAVGLGAIHHGPVPPVQAAVPRGPDRGISACQ